MVNIFYQCVYGLSFRSLDSVFCRAEVFNFSKVTFNFFPPWIDHAFNVELSKVREFGIDMYTLLCLNWITNKDLLYITWISAQ